MRFAAFWLLAIATVAGCGGTPANDEALKRAVTRFCNDAAGGIEPVDNLHGVTTLNRGDLDALDDLADRLDDDADDFDDIRPSAATAPTWHRWQGISASGRGR